jgi:hypothetical protein
MSYQRNVETPLCESSPKWEQEDMSRFCPNAGTDHQLRHRSEHIGAHCPICSTDIDREKVSVHNSEIHVETLFAKNTKSSKVPLHCSASKIHFFHNSCTFTLSKALKFKVLLRPCDVRKFWFCSRTCVCMYRRTPYLFIFFTKICGDAQMTVQTCWGFADVPNNNTFSFLAEMFDRVKQKGKRKPCFTSK